MSSRDARPMWVRAQVITEAVRQGRDPIGVIRDEEENHCIEFEASMYELAALS